MGGGGGFGLPMGGGGLGIGTIIVLGLIGYAFGIDPRILIGGAEILNGGGSQAPSYQTDRGSGTAKTGAPTDEMGSMISGVLGEIDDRWTLLRFLDCKIASILPDPDDRLHDGGDGEDAAADLDNRAPCLVLFQEVCALLRRYPQDGPHAKGHRQNDT